MIEKLKKARKSISPCLPPVWAGTGHLQTIFGFYMPSQRITGNGQHINVTLEKESERIHSTYFAGSSDTVIYLFHGLGGSIDSPYMQRIAFNSQQNGHHVFMNNHRGCGQGAGLATEPYHSGRSEDLSKVIEHGRKMLPNHKHVAIGFSLSANALLLLAAKFRGVVQPDLAIAVNAPINLDKASIKLRTGLNKIYDKRFTHELERYMKINRPHDVGDFSLVEDLRDFDERYTAPLSGFKSRADYYETCSAKQYLPEINIPTVIITAEDDPFIGVEDYKDAIYSPNVVVHIEKHGGHVGYLGRDGMGYNRWLDKAVESYLQAFAQS